ncbi:MAG: elongation factor G [Magnetococcales bacterium]|nr:elongation factor G [Magnetococcales bacterium]MBF0439931.1 elongation factor G [Magnetococcales bacterium]
MSNIPDITLIRNVALISHGGGGKTTLAESLLFNGGAIVRRGDVDKGTSVMSCEPEEIERRVTITTHVGHCVWRDRWFNLVDTPGYSDFLEATRGALNVVGGAVMIFSGGYGVKPENERLWAMASEAMVPVIGFINKLDRPRADFIRVLGDIESKLGVVALPLTIPIGVGEDFLGIVDLIPMTAWSARDGVFCQIELPESVRADALHYRTQLVEKIVETDDDLLGRYLETGEEPSLETLHWVLKEAVLTHRLLVVYCGSGLANIGVRSLANGIAEYLPSPLDKEMLKPLNGVDPDHPERVISRSPQLNEPFSAIVFKTVMDPFAGKLTVLRVFSGVLETDQPFLNSMQRTKEKGGRLFRLQGREMIPVVRLTAGEMGAIAKLENTHTGDTLCALDHPIRYERVSFLPPTHTFAVEMDAKQEEKVASGLEKLTEEDPTLHLHRDLVTHELILSGMGQTHLRVTLDRLKRKYGASVTLKMARPPFRETITKKVRVQGRLKKQTGGRGQFADCWLEMEPLPRDGGYQFENCIVGGVIPRQFIPSVEKGILEAMEQGVVGGFPVVDVKVSLVDGSYHTVDSSDHAFKTAGAMAFKKGLDEGGSVLLEPVMAMEVTVPDDVLGDVIGDINSRRGRVLGVTPKGAGGQIILAEVPMAEVLDYGNVLNGITSGRGLYTMRVSAYHITPSHIARVLLEQK